MQYLPNAQLNAALELYCAWLNSFNADGISDFTYTPAHFTDTTVNEFAGPVLIAEYNVDYHRAYVWQLSDGDDGGPASITVYFDYDNDGNVDAPRHSTQHFDTYVTVWLTDGELVNTHTENNKS